MLQIDEVGSADPHVTITLHHQCARFCKLAHIAHGTTSSQAMTALEAFDLDIHSCFSGMYWSYKQTVSTVLGHYALTCKRDGDVVSQRPLTCLDITANLYSVFWKQDSQQVWQPELPSREDNDTQCKELGWVCVSMVADAYRCLDDGVNATSGLSMSNQFQQANTGGP
ncbi:hypothetical protein EMCRGX_G029060 [Ephydatia muelleri]